ncbi:Tn3 family transposase [Streptomyces sp. NPDC048680]|uniref:Tn3 family transposase n=1 Tax=Streptomyces sp. NPDC048680 TaxID=3155492 RepID=UPI003422D9D6
MRAWLRSGDVYVPSSRRYAAPASYLFTAARWEGQRERFWPRIFASLLVELDRRTGFLDCLTHADGKQTRSPELKRNPLGVLIAEATNLGLVRMAEACGISPGQDDGHAPPGTNPGRCVTSQQGKRCLLRH